MQARLSLYVAACALVLFLHVVSARTVGESSREENNDAERIVGGQDAVKGQFPYAVALHYNDQFICTASVISPSDVLTAAHCVVFNDYPEPASSFYGTASLGRSDESVRIYFDKIIPHENYSSGVLDNDIALMQTTEPIPLGNDVEQIRIAASDTTDLSDCNNVTALGWGNTLRFGRNIPEILQHTPQNILRKTDFRCQLLGVNDNKVCASGFLGLTGICNGDSGGPLVCSRRRGNSSDHVQIGVASYGNLFFGCGKGSPAVWTRVGPYIEFILENAADRASIQGV